MRGPSFILFALPLALGGGCGGSSGNGIDAGADASTDVASLDAIVDVAVEQEAGFVEGPHGPFPQDEDNAGTVLSAPNVIPVFFANDALEGDLESLLSQLSTSTYWAALRKDYPVGPLTIATSIVLTDTPPVTATVSDVANFIAGKLDASDPAWPPAAQNNIYLMYYPSSTTLYDGSSVGCSGFAGYHSYWHTAAQATFVFAAVSRCDMLQTLDVATQNTTHELVEATTDPLFGTTPAYSGVDQAHAIWDYYPGGELADMCEVEALSYQRLIGTYLTARFWSNSGAAGGHDPCGPTIPYVYYNSVPVTTDDVPLTLGNGVTAKGVVVPLNQSKTIDVQLFSDAPTTSWTVQAKDASYLFGTGMPELTFSWDVATGNNGDTLHLTITRVMNNASIGGTEFVIYSQQTSSNWHAYFAVAGN